MQTAPLIFICLLAFGSVFGAVSVLMKKNGFAQLGNINGMHRNIIVGKVGQPNSVSATATGTLLQWTKVSSVGGYHYAILFDREDKAVGYTHQSAS